jgi:rhomboid family protein
MIPLRDTTRSKTTPFVNYMLIGLCGSMFLYELSLGEYLQFFISRFAVTPSHVAEVLFRSDVSSNAIAVGLVRGSILPLYPLVTSLFLHGGWLHLIGNMLYLFIFGDNVEDRLGHIGYLIFYLLVGIAASLTQVYFSQHSSVPLLGASGAIAGVMGAYLLLYPKARITTLIPLFIFFPIVDISAFFFLVFWFVMQFISGALSSGPDIAGGVAWWAHAGGFIAGAILLPVFLLLRKL